MASTLEQVSRYREEISEAVREIANCAVLEAVREIRDMIQEVLDDYETSDEPPREPPPSPRPTVHSESNAGGHPCTIGGCDFVGATTQGLGLHRTRTHRDQATHKCDVAGCDFRGHSQKSLDNHHRLRHRRADGGVKAEPVDHWKDAGEPGTCDVRDGKCFGGVSEWGCQYERTTDCKYTARRCQAHGGDGGCRSALGNHHKHHVVAEHDKPI